MPEAAVFVDLGLSKRQSKKVPVEAKRPIKVAYPQLHLDQPYIGRRHHSALGSL